MFVGYRHQVPRGVRIDVQNQEGVLPAHEDVFLRVSSALVAKEVAEDTAALMPRRQDVLHPPWCDEQFEGLHHVHSLGSGPWNRGPAFRCEQEPFSCIVCSRCKTLNGWETRLPVACWCDSVAVPRVSLRAGSFEFAERNDPDEVA